MEQGVMNRNATQPSEGLKRDLSGTLDDAEELVRHFVEEGYEHHVTAVYGLWADAVLHLGRQLGVRVDHV